jgi:hypothetical protein
VEAGVARAPVSGHASTPVSGEKRDWKLPVIAGCRECSAKTRVKRNPADNCYTYKYVSGRYRVIRLFR